jgi:hypothetical protein
MLLLALLFAAPAANLPELPADIPSTATKYTVTIMGIAAGQQAVWTEGDRLRVFFQYNDRGRGPKTYSTLVLQDGVLLERHTTLDPTLGAFETLYLDRPGQMAVGFRAIADRLPVQIRRGFLAGSLPVPPGMDARYRASWKKMLALVRELYEKGVPIEAGTDAMAGFGLHRELELDVEAGIPPAAVLRLATLARRTSWASTTSSDRCGPASSPTWC